jgi:hypothetical protein
VIHARARQWRHGAWVSVAQEPFIRPFSTREKKRRVWAYRLRITWDRRRQATSKGSTGSVDSFSCFCSFSVDDEAVRHHPLMCVMWRGAPKHHA